MGILATDAELKAAWDKSGRLDRLETAERAFYAETDMDKAATKWRRVQRLRAKLPPELSDDVRTWLAMTIRLFDEHKNGFGCESEVWDKVRGRGWYTVRDGWLRLTEMGRREIPPLLG